MDARAVGRRLKALRGGRSREEVALEVGISVAALTKYEQGERLPRDEVKLWLSQYYGQSIQQLFFEPREHVS